MSFAYPAVLVSADRSGAASGLGLARSGGRIALPFDHGGQTRGRVGPLLWAWPNLCRP